MSWLSVGCSFARTSWFCNVAGCRAMKRGEMNLSCA